MTVTAAIRRVGRRLAVALAFAAGGCAGVDRMADHASTYNLVVETVHNRVLLYNILRASEWRPMYFTAISKFTGNQGLSSASGALAIPFGGDAGSEFTLSPGLNFSHTPTYDVVVLDTENFMRGLLAPVAMDTIQVFWDEGWPGRLLLHLLVDRIEPLVSDGKGGFVPDPELESFDNRPEDRQAFERFSREIDLLLDCGLHVRRDLLKLSVARSLEPAVVNNLMHLVMMAAENLQLSEAGLDGEAAADGTVELHRPVALSQFHFAECPRSDLGRAGFLHSFSVHQPPHVPAASGSARLPERFAGFHIRSPQAILHYLGSLTRVQRDGFLPANGVCPPDRPRMESGRCAPYVPTIAVEESGEREALFRLVRVEGAQGNLIEVRYGGDTYAIPADGTGRSMQVLAFVSQILALQKNLDDFPATSTVRVIGQ
jgi:hypothetical protein